MDWLYCSAKAAGNDQVLTVGLSSEMNGTFSPMYYQTTNDSYVVDLVYQGLLKYNKKGELVADLAKSLPEMSEDGKTMTFKLKKGIQFSDGSKFTSKDVQTTFTVMADPSYTGRFANNVDFLDGYSEYHDADASSFTGVETPDNYTVVFHLDKPRIDAVSTLGTQKICSSEYLNYKKEHAKEILKSDALRNKTEQEIESRKNGVKYDYKNFDTNPGTGAKKIPALFFDFAKVGSGTTGINEVVNQSTKLNDGKYYTLSGQQVEKPTAGGIYIHNGRKFVVK